MRKDYLFHFGIILIHLCFASDNLYCQSSFDSSVEKVVAAHESHLAKITSLKANVQMICEYHQANQDKVTMTGSYYYTSEISRTSFARRGALIDEYIQNNIVYRFEKRDGKLDASKGKNQTVDFCNAMRAGMVRLQLPSSRRYTGLQEFLSSADYSPTCKQITVEGKSKYKIACKWKTSADKGYETEVYLIINPDRSFMVEKLVVELKQQDLTLIMDYHVEEFVSLKAVIWFPRVTVQKITSSQTGLMSTSKWRLDNLLINQPFDKSLFAMPFASTIRIHDLDKEISYKVDGQGNQVSAGKEMKTALAATPLKASDTLVFGKVSVQQDNTNYLQWMFIFGAVAFSLTAICLIIRRNRLSHTY